MPTTPDLLRYPHPTGVVFHSDPGLLLRRGILVAFSERTGGVSAGPWRTLNLAGHVGDRPGSVDENRRLFLASLGFEHLVERLTTSEQVHGHSIALVTDNNIGAGARVASGPPPIPATDALVTTLAGAPLLLMYADCVPVVLVAERPTRSVAVVHAGWRGALASLPGSTARHLAGEAGCDVADLAAYIGPYVGSCCYSVGDEILSQFCNKFDTIAAVDGRLDLGAAVTESLMEAGVIKERIARVAACTAESTDRFFSYRANRVTGRHGALALITEVE
ncbi:MAG: polyphenol oxidase family protein [Coriobacteriia bacterium]|nr:polyphenol oxidase family protein [Coriobacteriia bacterium]